MNIQWFPGHMAKARRLIEENLKLVDAVCVVLDARIPRASLNPELDALAERKPFLYVLCRDDLADPKVTALWLGELRASGKFAVAADAKSGEGVNAIHAAVRGLLKDKLASRAEKGQSGRAIRLMAAGIPNVGKSSLINRLSGRKPAKTEDRPGVTRGKQWIDIGKGLLLLDTPGVLPPKLSDRDEALNLAFTGAIRDQILDTEELASLLCQRIKDMPEFVARCKADTLEDIAAARGCLAKGGVPDTERMAALILDEFRAGKFGRISLEVP
ncbi:ribosome biogenesis GTPase A [Clostridia bacterium]|nr:ribosome biogenesis GTPase A [Clostridia bacterium]